MRITFDEQSLDLTPTGKGFKASLGGRTCEVEVLRAENGRLDLLIDNKRLTAFVSSEGGQRWVTVNGETFILTKSSGIKRRGPEHEHASELSAPMPGQVRIVNVYAGDSITKGQTLLVLEAMKMEIRIQAPKSGKIKTVLVKQGQTVEREQILIEMAGEDE
jgi:biotin carboxyl carrier protein